MAQVKPEYEIVEEFSSIASSIAAKYPDVFPGIDVDKVRCVAITNKTRSEKKKLWELKAVTMPIRLDCPFAWYVILYMEDWVTMGPKHKQLMVANVLCAVPESEEEGKVCPPDLKGYGVMLRTFGVDYLDKPEEEMKDLLEQNIRWNY